MKDEREIKLRELAASNLAKLREERGKTQKDIAKLTNKSENAVGSWEQGLSQPSACVLHIIAKYYGVPMEWFYEEH